MRAIVIGACLLCSLSIVLLLPVTTGASEDIASQEELDCPVCHQDPEGELLTDQGRYYGLMRTLEGYRQVVDQFGGCGYCHVPDVGSNDFTREGLRFRWMMEDMKGLRAWLEENHPTKREVDEIENEDPADS